MKASLLNKISEIKNAVAILIDPETASLASSQVGSHQSGWLSFQPLYQMIVRQDTDFLLG